MAAGTYTLETRNLRSVTEFWGNIWGDKYSRFIIFALVLYAFTALGDRYVIAHLHVPPMIYLAIGQLFAAVQFVLVGWYYRRREITRSFQLVRTQWKSIVVVALLTSAYRLMQVEATALAAIGLVIAVKRSSSFFTTVIGGEIFHDRDVLRKSIACLIMVIGVWMVAMK